jgi:hypothetical protein
MSDKAESGYLPHYFALAAELGIDAVVCELGVLQGHSLRLWQTLFPRGTVVGVDVDPQAVWPEGTHKIVCAQGDPRLPGLLRAAAPAGFDLIVDDASHDGTLTRQTWVSLWPLLTPGGLYVIEDWGVGFRRYDAYGFDGSMRDLARDLLDTLDFDAVPQHATTEITYREGMIVMRKSVVYTSP